jgi:putative ABC transport system permease protein
MLRLHLKIALRHLLKGRLFTILNLTGLSIGLASAFLIYCWAADEWRVGKFHDGDERRFEVMRNTVTASGIETAEQTPGLLAGTLQERMPEVAYAVPVIPTSLYDDEGILSDKDTHVKANRVFAGKDYFHVFPYTLLDGNKDEVLTGKYSVAISSALAMQLFNTTENLVGKTISWNQVGFSGDYIISGVFVRPDDGFDIIFSYTLFLDKNAKKAADWGNNDPSTFVLLKDKASPATLDQKMTLLLRERSAKTRGSLFLQLYSDKYLHNHYENGRATGGRIAYVTLFVLIALFILVIACINFMNLSTARAARRVKEVGIKKATGAGRGSLVAQYLGESLLLTFLSMLIALLWVLILWGPFNAITGKHLMLRPEASLWFGAIGLFTALVAGSYPALYLSRFSPVAALKGKLPRSVTEVLVRKGLVVFQFILSIVFIISVLVIYKQVQLVQHKNLGYNRDHIIWFDKGGLVLDSSAYYKDGGGFTTELQTFITGLKNIPGVVDAANFRHDVTNRQGGTSDISWPGKDPSQAVTFTDLGAGYDFIETLGIEMETGRTFSRAYGDEQSKVIVNEAAIRAMGLKNPIGKVMHIWGQDKEIIGVTKDFNFQSLHAAITPCFFDFHFNHWASKIMVRIAAGTERETIARIQQYYRASNPGLALQYRFLDEDYQKLYASENQIAALSKYFAAMAIILSCLGLFGLAAFTVQQRLKEISIRKIVGATAAQIIALLSKDFLKLILIAALAAFPLAWLLMHRWLSGFAYRVDIGAGVFVIAGSSILLITLLVVGAQSIRVAFARPVKGLE